MVHAKWHDEFGHRYKQVVRVWGAPSAPHEFFNSKYLFLQCNLMGHHCSNHTAAEDVWSTKCGKSHCANRSTCVLCKGLLNPCCLCVPLELRVQVDSTHSIGSIIVFITLGRPLGAVLVLSSWS